MPTLNILVALGILLIFAVILVFVFTKKKGETQEIAREDKLTMERMCDLCVKELARLSKDDNFFGRTDEEWEALYKRKKRIQKALRRCRYGEIQYKTIVKDLIRNILDAEIGNEDKMLDTLDYHSELLDPMIKFEILLYRLKKKYKKGALEYLINTYSWAEPKHDINKSFSNYAVLTEEVDEAYEEEITTKLSYAEMLDVTATLVYQKILGFGILDTILEMDIDGVNWGNSGAIVTDIINPGKVKETQTKSVWIYFHGTYIHFRFLNFYKIEEMRRITLAICRYNNPGPLTEKRGYIVNTMWDQSRVLALRPFVSESWAAFVRKFSLGSLDLEHLLDPVDRNTGEHVYGNTQLVYGMIKYLMTCLITSAFTGRQGSGKTTMMARAIEFIDPKYPMRILEMKPELYLREIYRQNNILSVAETDWVTAEELQDALKKSDAAITIIGEVATNAVATRMLQMRQVSSIFEIFSHHAISAENLVRSLTNSIVAESHGADTPETVMPQVINAIHIDIHLDYDTAGHRFVERITEIVPLDEIPYPEYNRNDPVNSMNEIRREYYVRRTDRKPFECVDIIRFNKETWSYEVGDSFISEGLTRQMLNNCPKDELEGFKNFVISNWG